MSPSRTGAKTDAPAAQIQDEALKVTALLTGAIGQLILGETCWLTRTDLKAIVTGRREDMTLSPVFLATFKPQNRRGLEAWFASSRPAIATILETPSR